MENIGGDAGAAARLIVLLKVERSAAKRDLVERIMAKQLTAAEKVRLIRQVDERDESELRRTAAPAAGNAASDGIEVPPPEPAPAVARPARSEAAGPAAARPAGGGKVEVLAEDSEFEQRSRELAKVRRRLYRPLPPGGLLRVFRDRARIQDFAADTGMVKVGLLARSLALCTEVVAAKSAILRDTEFPGLHETLKPLVAECWRHLALAHYNRLAALYRFIQNLAAHWNEYQPADPLSRQMVFFQNVWPDYLALFVQRVDEELSTKAILIKAMKAVKAKEAHVDLALARLATIEVVLGNILRAVHFVGWRRYFNFNEVLVNKSEALFMQDAWDSPPDVRREIAAWQASYQSQLDKLAVDARVIRRIRYLVPAIPGGVDRPDLAWIRFWQPKGWSEGGLPHPLAWLYEATRQFLLGHGRLLAGTVKLTGGGACRTGVVSLAAPVLEITETAKRLHQLREVLGELDQARIAALRERPEKGIESEREALRLSEAIVDGFGVLSEALLHWLAADSLAAPRELQEPTAPGAARRGLAQEMETVAEPPEIAGKTVIESIMDAARVSLILPLAMGRTGLLERWNRGQALEAQMAALQAKVDRLKGQGA